MHPKNPQNKTRNNPLSLPKANGVTDLNSSLNLVSDLVNVCQPEARAVSGFSGFANNLRRVLTTTDDFTAEPTWLEQRLTSFRYMPFLSYDNYLLNELKEIALHSPTHGSILRQKIRMVNGAGLDLVGKKTLLSGQSYTVTDNDKIQVEQYLEVVNAEGETLNDIRRKVEADLEQYGNAFVHLIIYKGQLSQYHLPVSEVRPIKMQAWERMPTKIGHSRYFDGLESVLAPRYVEEYPLFPNFGKPTGFEGSPLSNVPDGEHSVIHICNRHSDFKYWGVPTYLPAKLAAQGEYKINKFNNSQLDNGFMPSGLVQFFGSIPQEKAAEVIARFRESYTGTGNNSRLVAQMVADPNFAAKFTAFSQQYDGQFLDMFDTAQRQIIVGHEWFPALAGIAISGQLGNVQQLRTEFEIAKNTVIKDEQRIICEGWLNPILRVLGQLHNRPNFAKMDFEILPVSLPLLIGDLNAKDAMTVSEMRKELGLPEQPEQITIG